MSPLEEIQIQKHGSFELNKIQLKDEVSAEKFKPGLLGMVTAFLNDKRRTYVPSERIELHLSLQRKLGAIFEEYFSLREWVNWTRHVSL